METYNGHVRTPNDAILLFEACRIGLLPRVQRRLSEKERQQIKSGSVFVWDEREAGMRRWTDGKSWSASRVSGSFLTYREMEGKRGGNALAAAPAKRASGKSPDGSATGDSDGEGPDGYRYKPDGLMKQSFSITTSSGQHLHLISYFSRSNPTPLMQPSNDPSLRHIRPPKNMYPESTVNETQSVPPVTRGPMPGSPYASAPHNMPNSPYPRPGPPPQQVFVPMYHPPPTPPNGTPPYQYAYYGQPHISYGGVIYAQPQYHHPQGHVFDRPPPPISNSNIPHPPPGHAMISGHPGYAPHPGHPGHHPGGHHPGHPGPQYIANPPPRAMQATELAQHQQHSNNHHHVPTPSVSIPEQGPQLPAINSAVAASNQVPTPSPSESKSQESLPVPESNNAANGTSPARTIPTLGSILNNHDSGAEQNQQSNSRSGSRSPNSSQRPIAEFPAGRLTSSSVAADHRALDKLNKAMFVRT